MQDRADTHDLRALEDALGRLGARPTLAIPTLLAAYGGPARRYHTLEHVRACLAWLRAAQELAKRPDELLVAIWFHDAVYEPTAHDNEARSAALFRSIADAGGLDAAVVQRIARLIESTARHDASDNEPDAALLCDIDLAILGSPPRVFDGFEEDIRAEYGFLPEDAYRAGRAAVLRGFLERVVIYRHPWFASRLESLARQNLARTVARLEGREAPGGTPCGKP